MEQEYMPTAEARELLRGLVDAAKERGLKGKSVYHPLRVALSGRDEGPELFYLVGGLGKGKITARLDAAAAFVAREGEARPS
jgi:glutamyl/glutaminyl-tRNA synthetase